LGKFSKKVKKNRVIFIKKGRKFNRWVCPKRGESYFWTKNERESILETALGIILEPYHISVSPDEKNR
jgi:hypothetical protein